MVGIRFGGGPDEILTSCIITPPYLNFLASDTPSTSQLRAPSCSCSKLFAATTSLRVFFVKTELLATVLVILIKHE